MKTIFTVETSNDGLQNACFTNIKAVYEFITNQLGFTGEISPLDSKCNKPLSYNNFVKEVRANQKEKRFCVASLSASYSDTITISELGILSK